MGSVASYTPEGPPGDFPNKEHRRLLELVLGALTPQHPAWKEFVFALQAVVHRFCALAEHDEDFTQSVRTHGDTPPMPHQYIQQRELFEFFENGHAALESTWYGLFAIGAVVSPSKFPFATDRDRKQVIPKAVDERFRSSFPDAPLSKALRELLEDPLYKQWGLIRNVIAHRVAPGRIIWLSMKLPDGSATPVRPTEWSGLPVVIDENTTASRRAWLAKSLAAILDAANRFMSETLT